MNILYKNLNIYLYMCLCLKFIIKNNYYSFSRVNITIVKHINKEYILIFNLKKFFNNVDKSNLYIIL